MTERKSLNHKRQVRYSDLNDEMTDSEYIDALQMLDITTLQHSQERSVRNRIATMKNRNAYEMGMHILQRRDSILANNTPRFA